MVVIAIIVGAVLGGFWGRDFGVPAGALLGWLIVRSWRQQRDIVGLQQSLKELLARPVVEPAPPSIEPAALVPEVARNHEAAPKPTPTEFTSPITPPIAAAAPPVDIAWQQPARRPPPRADPLAPIKAWFFGGNTIVKAGIGILFIGLAFLAKYATEHVSVPIEVRLAGIAGVAVVLLVIGWRLRARRPGYAQVLQGGAVAVLYLTLFVAFRLYGVLAVGPVFGLMVAVAALAAALAVLQDARSLAVIGALGGFATPLLVSTGSGNHVALFSYYLVLDLGIAAVAWHKTWRALNLVGFVATFLVATAWGVLKYQPSNYATSQGFLVAFFLLFVAILLLPARRAVAGGTAAPQPGDRWVNGALLFGLPTITFVLQHGLVRDTEYGTAISALVLAGFYVLLARAMRSRPSLAVTFDASLAIAIVFLTLVIPFALDAHSTAGAWALEGAGLVWLGMRQSRALSRAFGYALMVLAGLAMVVAHDHYGAPTAVFNATLINGLLAAAAALAAAYFARHAGAGATRGTLAHTESFMPPLLIAAGVAWALVAAQVQIDNFVDARFTLAAWLASVSAIALVCTLLSARLDWPQVAFAALGHAPLLALAVIGSAVELREPIADGGWWAWPVALAVHGVVLWRAAARWPAPLQQAIHALGVLVLAGLGALQGRAITHGWGDDQVGNISAWAWLGWLVVPALLLMLLLRAGTARRWPVSAAPKAYRSIAAALLTLGLLLWVLGANIDSNGSALPLPYAPLVNPLDLGVAAALLAAWTWLRSEAARTDLHLPPQTAAASVGAVGFVWGFATCL